MPRIRKPQNQPTISRTVWRIAVYIRLSKDDGNDESLSVTNQRKIITEYIEEFFEGEYIIVDVYADDGLTGTDYERPEFQRLIHDVEAGTVNCIICKTLSRAFRNYSDQGYFLEKVFPLYGIRFISIGDPSLDTFKNPDAVQGIFIAFFSAEERETISLSQTEIISSSCRGVLSASLISVFGFLESCWSIRKIASRE